MVNNLIFYENIYVTSNVIDSVWRSLILSTKIYNEFCIELWGGYIDRIESISSDEFLLKSTQLKEYLEYHQKLIKSLEVFWKLRNDDNFEYDSKLYNIAIKKSELNDVLSYVEDKVAKLSHYFEIDKVYHYSEILYSLILLQHKDLLANEDEIYKNYPTS